MRLITRTCRRTIESRANDVVTFSKTEDEKEGWVLKLIPNHWRFDEATLILSLRSRS